eukprot:4149180-Alexandrium_andersonii.AAC.1
MRHCSRRSKLELRGRRNGISIGPRSSRGAFCAVFVCADATEVCQRNGPAGAPEALLGGGPRGGGGPQEDL